MVEERRTRIERRSGKDRRSGADTRTEEERSKLGERRWVEIAGRTLIDAQPMSLPTTLSASGPPA
jgi:hypothetical protein